MKPLEIATLIQDSHIVKDAQPFWVNILHQINQAFSIESIGIHENLETIFIHFHKDVMEEQVHHISQIILSPLLDEDIEAYNWEDHPTNNDVITLRITLVS